MEGHSLTSFDHLVSPNSPRNLSVIVSCPKCEGKASFNANEHANTFTVKPGQQGYLICGNCGANKSYLLKDLAYYYHISIGNRTLVARSKENFEALRNYFLDGYKNKVHVDSTIDFPKVFYTKKEIIVKKINNFLEKDRP